MNDPRAMDGIDKLHQEYQTLLAENAKLRTHIVEVLHRKCQHLHDENTRFRELVEMIESRADIDRSRAELRQMQDDLAKQAEAGWAVTR